MKIKLQGIALGIMATGGLLVPLSVMSSCNSSNDSNGIVNYMIAAKSDSQLLIADISDQKYKEISTLEKVFSGVNDSNLQNLTVNLITLTVGSSYKITLTAKEGYKINGESSLDSSVLVINTVNYLITPKSNPQLLISDIINGEHEKISTLEKVFSGVNEGNFQNLTASLFTISAGSRYKIILNAKDGYKINGESSIESINLSVVENYLIAPKSNPQLLISDIINGEHEKISTLSKVFDGINVNSLQNLTASLMTMNEGSRYKIILTAKDGYKINGELSLESNVLVIIVNYDITTKSNPQLANTDISDDGYKEISTLSKVFDGINVNSLQNLTPSLKIFNEGAGCEITLTANEGYKINGQSSLKSDFITVAQSNINITPKALPTWTLSFNDLDGDNWKKLETIEKVFEFGVQITNQEELDKIFEISINNSISATKVIALSVKPGYLINNSTIRTISSNPFTKPINYLVDVVANPFEETIRLSEIIVGEGYKNFSVISKLFTGAGISKDSLANMNMVLIEITPKLQYQIKLTPKGGYNFNGKNEEISSAIFTVKFININIELMSSVPQNLTEQDLHRDRIKLKAFLSQFFVLSDQQDQDWINNTLNVAYIRNETENSHRIELSPKDMDVKLNSHDVINSNKFSLIFPIHIDGVIKNPIPLDIIQIMPENLSKLEVLSLVFNVGWLTQANLDQKDIYVAFRAGDKIVLTANQSRGYKILLKDGTYHDSIESEFFNRSYDVTMSLQPKPEIQISNKVTQKDIDNVNSVETLSKLFNGMIEKKHLNWFKTVTIGNDETNSSKKRVLLVLKNGYTFGGTTGGTTIQSSPFTVA
ncbi:MAG: hypothetical protein ACRCWU_01580 [Metamycoplasmataceae bacterium]